MKYGGLYLIKYVQDLHIENYEILLREIKEDLSNGSAQLAEQRTAVVIKLSSPLDRWFDSTRKEMQKGKMVV